MNGCTITRDYGVTYLDNIPHIGITKLLSTAGESPELVKWKISEALKRHREILAQLEDGDISEDQYARLCKPDEILSDGKELRDAAASKGRSIHSMVEAFQTGDSEKLAKAEAEFPAEYAAFSKWLNENDGMVVESEIEVFHSQLRVHGRFDAMIRTNRGTGIYEIKTKDRVFFEAIMQASFYYLCDTAVIKGQKVVNRSDYVSILLLKENVCREVPVEVPTERNKTFYAYKHIFREKFPNSPIFRTTQ